MPLQVQAAIKNPPWADIFGSKWNDLDTTTSANNFKNNLSATYTRFVTLNTTAAVSMGASYAQSDAIWVNFGHGGPGFITFCNPPEGANCTSVLRVNNTDGSCSAPDACLSTAGTSIHYIRLMIFAGCETAVSAGTRNLIQYAKNTNGVDSTVGWNPLVYWPHANTWATRMAVYLSAGNTVNSSLFSAGLDVKNTWGSAMGWDQWSSLNGGIKVIPAAYGT
jgi:hypothetical protein